MKKLKAVTISLAFILSLVGCGSTNSAVEKENTSSSGTKTIKFMHLWPEGTNAAQNKILNEIIDDFESENPGIKIEQEILANEQYKDKLKVLSASDKLPDVGMAWPGGWLQPYVQGNKIASFDDVIDSEYRNKFVDGTIEGFEVDGKVYGLPTDLNIAIVYYNKQIFEQNSLEVPTTYDEFLNVIKTLTNNGVTPIALGNQERWTGSLWYMYLADRIGGTETIVNAVNRKQSFEDPTLIQAAGEIQNLVDLGAFQKGYNGATSSEAESLFTSGQAAMYLTGTWALPSFTQGENFTQEFKDSVDYFKFPSVEGGKGNINSFVGGNGGLFVSEKSEVKEEAKRFVKYFTEKFGERSLGEAGIIPAYKLNADDYDLPDLYLKVLKDLNDASNITLFADNIMTPGPAQVHLDMIQSLFGKEATPEEFVKAQEEALAKEAGE
ncbi:extracellular solute-binding protein [Paenibacillus barengoltzii]|uniref:extracellular solute-binding protein n=1 Tax=Paenibacillus barengoltzii TaxID=343517 RepID=UPI002DB873E6|nr:extracellular solute-binding protein [Paenibacillus barengoltzii]MEC2346658.1 extracellular solute-binding protein [Paenibacillus barengoltzii]